MTNKSAKILLVDDDDSIRWVLNELLVDIGHQVEQVSSAELALQRLGSYKFDLLISDVRMSGKSGMDLLAHCQNTLPDLPVVIMTAHSDLESAVSAYQQGAFEYLPKPFDLAEVVSTVERALSKQADHKTEENVKPTAKHFSIIGESPAMQDLYRAIGRLSTSHVTVLIHGESGTGKELVASALHQNSPRKKSPFIALNMAAIPKDLIESELFGHEKGAFTGANSRYLGRFEQANGGTLFLDEIGDMPIETQTRLLRVLSEGAFYRIGSSQPTKVNVRIIAATHQNLANKVEQGEFREDLFHRLNVIPLNLPPLRNRSDDIPLLANHFLSSIAKEINEPCKQLSQGAVKALQAYHWPGNVRQLENTCRWLTVMANSRVVIDKDLPQEITNISNKIKTHKNNLNWKEQLSLQLQNDYKSGKDMIFLSTQAELENLLIKTALKISEGKKAEAAKILGWGRNTLTRKLKGS